MPLKCQFCQEESVVEEDVGDGREQLICVECGAVATLPAVQLNEPTAFTGSSSSSSGTICQEIDDICETDVCQSCGEDLPPGEGQLCSECKSLEQGQDEPQNTSPETKCIIKKIEVNSQTAAPQRIDISPLFNSKLSACSSCGSFDVVVDELGTEEQIVCRSCGHVVGKQNFTTNESEISSTRTIGNQLQTLPVFARPQGHCFGFKMGMEKISLIQQKLALSVDIKEGASAMFERLFYMPAVVNKSIRKKAHIATACVYVACRRDSLPVSMIHFQEFRDSIGLFTRALKLVTTLLDIKLLPPALGTQVRHLFYSAKLGVGNAASAKMLTQIRDIVFLCREAWLTSGRHTQPIILLAMYYVYRNCDDCPKRMSVPKFCSQFKLPPIGRKMLSDFQKLFLHLASHLPWAKQEHVKHSTIHLFIEDILQYKKSLLHLAFEKPELGQECTPWEIKPEVKSDPNPHENDVTNYSVSVASLAGLKKEVLLPESFKRGREAEPVVRAPEPVIPAHLDLDCPDIKPSDFSEEEISSYILTSAEMNSIREAKENLFREKKPRLK